MSDLDTVTLYIDDEPQFFFDNGIIESVHNLTRTIHSPDKHRANPVIRSDKPWEHVTYFTGNGYHVWRDRQAGRFHCLYTSWKFDREKRAPSLSLVNWRHSRLRQCYAYSDDGVDWIKPPMGIQEEGGHDTNIVFGTEDYGSVYSTNAVEDPFEEDPEKRFKAVYTYVPPGGDSSVIKRAAYSPDGVHWTPYEQAPAFGKQGDHLGDVFVGAFDPASRTYIGLTRHPWMGNAPRTRGPSYDLVVGGPGFDNTIGPANRRNRRRIFLTESRDFLNWSEPRAVLAPDPDIDNLDDAFYTMTPMWLGGQWLGFIAVFHMVSNTFTVQLAHSRDGRNWNRIAPGHTWLDRGPVGSWEEFMVNVSAAPVVVDDELWVYYGGAKNHHDWWFSGHEKYIDLPETRGWDHVGYHLGLAKMRNEGFVSLGAHRVREGLLQTQPFGSHGDRLLINAACGPDGYIKVEVTDPSGKVLPDNSLDEADVFTGDATRHEVSWRGDPTVRGLEGTADWKRRRAPYRALRFVMRDAELYSFRLVSSEKPAK